MTGGSRGISAAVARRLAAEGAAVAIGYRGNQEAADALVAELAAIGGQAIAIQTLERREDRLPVLEADAPHGVHATHVVRRVTVA